MNRYFFDLVGRKRSEFDYCGIVLPSPETAREFAELMAMDLDVCEEGVWVGWVISVRDALGKQFYCVPVPTPMAEPAGACVLAEP